MMMMVVVRAEHIFLSNVMSRLKDNEVEAVNARWMDVVKHDCSGRNTGHWRRPGCWARSSQLQSAVSQELSKSETRQDRSSFANLCEFQARFTVR